MKTSFTRRDFVKTSASLAALAANPYWMTSRLLAQESKNERPLIGAIGLGGQGSPTPGGPASTATSWPCATCSGNTPSEPRNSTMEQAEIFEDYRKLLDRKDIEAVTIGTPDHWHTEIALAALEAGKHVYCEKPLTLTIDEGKQLVAMVKKTGKVMQVGTQQRGDQFELFGRAVATVRSGQLGKIHRRSPCSLPLSTEEGGPFAAQPVPEGLNWDFWLGQAPQGRLLPRAEPFRFRWWYEYSGGIVTDWGAHHMDIAHWALDVENSGPMTIDGTKTELPEIAGGFNTPKLVTVDYLYPGDVQLQMQAQPPGDEGVLFEGENGRMFVNRGRITGKPIEEQDADPKLKEADHGRRREAVQRQHGQDGRSHGQLLRSLEARQMADLGRREPAPLGQRLPLGQHLDPPGAQADLGRRQRRIRRRQRSQQHAQTRAARAVHRSHRELNGLAAAVASRSREPPGSAPR